MGKRQEARGKRQEGNFKYIPHQIEKRYIICFWTDNETWAGRKHPTRALAEYRQKINPKAKAVYVTLAPYNITLVDPEDANSWDIAGFDPGTPRLIQMLATGEL